MAPKGQASWEPAIGDDKVKAATGRNWMGWFVILNRAKASALPHREIAALLGGKYGVPPWWRQMIAVEYERARGGRQRHERPGGKFSVSVTKVIPVSLARLFAAATDAESRKAWFPRGTFAETSKTKNKYWRGTWKKDRRLEFGFYARGKDKAQIAVQVDKLAKTADVEGERKAWKAALDKLVKMLEA
jgi:hypothetical protein